jgi:hypothetical protein
MTGRLHFVGFRDDRYWVALRVFGAPDFVHRYWDHRARLEAVPGDTVVFAYGTEQRECSRYSFDDSMHF